MDSSEKVEHLARVSLLAPLAPAELGWVASLLEERTAAPGEVVCREGDPGHELFVIVGGEAAVDQGGRRLRVMQPGDAFGELALLDRGPRSATVTAEGELHLLVLREVDFSSLLDEIPAVAHRLLALLAARLRAAERDRAPDA